MGDWYSQWETPSIYVSPDNTCSRSQYGSLPQGVNNISLYIISTYADTGLGDVCGWIQPEEPMNPTGDILLYMGTEGSPSMILDTDYESFAASYSCENHPLELTHRTSAGIDTRDPIPSQETVRFFKFKLISHNMCHTINPLQIDKALEVRGVSHIEVSSSSRSLI